MFKVVDSDLTDCGNFNSLGGAINAIIDLSVLPVGRYVFYIYYYNECLCKLNIESWGQLDGCNMYSYSLDIIGGGRWHKRIG